MPDHKAAMLLIATDSGLLMHLRDDKPSIPNPSCWAEFGGAVEESETIKQTLHREVLEETGLDINNAAFLTTETDHEGDGREVSLFYITGSYRPEDIDLREGAGVAVHSLEDLRGLKMSPFVRRAICSHLLPVLTQPATDHPDDQP